MELKLQHVVLLSYVKLLRLLRDRTTTKSHKKKLDHGCAESLETSSYKKLLLLLFSSWDFLASSYDHKDSPAAVDLQY
jgi:hypothetical protein